MDSQLKEKKKKKCFNEVQCRSAGDELWPVDAYTRVCAHIVVCAELISNTTCIRIALREEKSHPNSTWLPGEILHRTLGL